MAEAAPLEPDGSEGKNHLVGVVRIFAIAITALALATVGLIVYLRFFSLLREFL